MDLTHPFLRGLTSELSEKKAFVDALMALPGLAAEHPGLAAGAAGVGLLAGGAAIKGLRHLQGGKPLFGKKPIEEAVRKGFSGKALAGAGLAGAAGGYYLASKKDKE